MISALVWHALVRRNGPLVVSGGVGELPFNVYVSLLQEAHMSRPSPNCGPRASHRHSRTATTAVVLFSTLLSVLIFSATPARAEPWPFCKTVQVLDQNFNYANVALCVAKDGANWRASATWLTSSAPSHVMFVELLAPDVPGGACVTRIGRGPSAGSYYSLFPYGATVQTDWRPRWFLGEYCAEYWNFYNNSWHLGGTASFRF